jgi:type I restriction enzyme S subunit
MGAEAPSRARQIIRTGDVLVATTRPNLNAVAMVPPDLDNQICSTGFCVLRATEEVIPGFLLAFVQSADFVAAVSELVKGALYPAMTDRQVRDVRLALPGISQQRRIAAVLSEQLATVERAGVAAEAQLEAAKVLPAAYLRAVFSSTEAQRWPTRRLGAVCRIQLGKMLSPASKTGASPQPYLRNANVQWNGFDLSEVAEMDFSKDEQEKFALKPGDLLVCEGGEPGRAAVWNGEIAPCYYQKALHRLRPVSADVNPSYVMYRLWVGAIEAEFLGSHAKTTIAHLPAIRLADLPIGLPPISVQDLIARRLAGQISAADGTRNRLEEQLAAINALPAALLRRAFRGEL